MTQEILPVILFVDDEATSTKYFQLAIDKIAPVVIASSVDEGKTLLDQFAQSLLVVVSDQRMPGQYGNELLFYAHQKYPHMVRILTTAYSEIADTIDAVNHGQIHRYLQKPWDITALRLEIKQAVEFATLRKDHAALLHEKLTIQKRQVLGHRVSLLFTLAGMLTKDDQQGAHTVLDAYVNLSKLVALDLTMPDWSNINYEHWLEYETKRFIHFWRDLTVTLASVQEVQSFNEPSLQMLKPISSDIIHIDKDKIIILQPHVLLEFFTSASEINLSVFQVHWLAFLIYLHRNNKTLKITRQEEVIQALIVPTETTNKQFADMLEQLTEQLV